MNHAFEHAFCIFAVSYLFFYWMFCFVILLVEAKLMFGKITCNLFTLFLCFGGVTLPLYVLFLAIDGNEPLVFKKRNV